MIPHVYGIDKALYLPVVKLFS